MANLFNIFGFQASWWCCVLGTQNGFPLLGPLVMLLFIIIHFKYVAYSFDELKLIIIGSSLGVLVDGSYKFSGLIFYMGDSFNLLPPLWIIAMWAGFCSTIRHSLRWLDNNYLLSFLMGFIFGPLSYLAGYNFDVISMTLDYKTMLILSFSWGLSIPLLFFVNTKLVTSN